MGKDKRTEEAPEPRVDAPVVDVATTDVLIRTSGTFNLGGAEPTVLMFGQKYSATDDELKAMAAAGVSYRLIVAVAPEPLDPPPPARSVSV